MDYDQGLITASHTEYKEPVEELDTEFKRRFPPDPLGKELDDGARVWKVYRDEATAYDTTMLDGWSQTLDILLIFAGLFSAVATAFVIESYQLLGPDKDAYILTALYIIATASNSSTTLLLPPPPPFDTHVSSLSRWINGLWFTSILLSLSVALLSILVKQWIGEYRARNNASAKSPRHWARRRELYFQALNTWPVAELVSVLPVLLHVSLFLFFAGVVAFLWTSDRAISVWIIAMGLSLASFYLACTLVPLWIPECPTSTPLVHQLRRRLITIEILVLRLFRFVISSLSRFTGLVRTMRHDTSSRHGAHEHTDRLEDVESFSFVQSQDIGIIVAASTTHNMSYSTTDLAARLDEKIISLHRGAGRAQISRRLDLLCDQLDASALHWLVLSVSDSDAVAVGLQAFSGLDPDSRLADELRKDPSLLGFTASQAVVRLTSRSNNDAEVARIVRSMLAVKATVIDDGSLGNDPSLTALLEDASHADAALCRATRHWDREPMRNNAILWRAVSPSITSTALLLLRINNLDLEWIFELLLCCNFWELKDPDWRFVLRLVGLHFDGNKPPLRMNPRVASSTLNLVDVLAQLVMDERHLDGEQKGLAAEVISRLILVLPSSKFDQLVHYPFFVHYLARHGEFAPITDGDVHLHIAVSLRTAWYVTEYTPTMFHLLWLAFYNAVSASPPEETIWATISFCEIGLARALYPFENTWSAQYPITSAGAERRLLNTALDFMVSPPSVLRPHQSLWQLLDGGRHRDMTLWGFGQLALNLVEAVNISKRLYSGDGIGVDAFFEQLQSNFPMSMMPDDGDYFVWLVVHMLRHCIELRPTWWLETLSNVHDGNRDDWKIMAVKLDGYVARLGPCTNCLGIPLGWQEEYDDDPLSTTYTFHPCS